MKSSRHIIYTYRRLISDYDFCQGVRNSLQLKYDLLKYKF